MDRLRQTIGRSVPYPSLSTLWNVHRFLLKTLMIVSTASNIRMFIRTGSTDEVVFTIAGIDSLLQYLLNE